jgi:RimJ/RimL family protein N-acetyltransferase
MSTTSTGGPAAAFHGFRSFEVRGEGRLVSTWQDGQLTVRAGDAEVASFVADPGDVPRLRLATTSLTGAELADAATAALEALTTMWGPKGIDVQLEEADGEAVLRRRGLLLGGGVAGGQRGGRCHADLLWQYAPLWMAQTGPAYPMRYTMTGEKRHPLRPPKPHGLVYARYIPWLRRTMTLHAATVERDLGSLHRWMNDPDVAYFWQEEGDEEKHRRYLQGLIDDPHMLPLVASFDGEPFGYFEVYWAKENRIAPFYDAQDHDRGWHVLIGEPAFRGKAFLTAWFPAIQHFQFLDDPRTQRIVGEPRADHHRQIANLDRAGFSKVKEFDFPHKRAMLVMLLRERFFGEGLYLPKSDG